MKEEKLSAFIDKAKKDYRKDPIEIAEGLDFNQYDTLKRIDYYTNNAYLTGDVDALGRKKPFYNITNYRNRVAKVATDLDIANIRAEGDDETFFVQSMILNKELFKWMKESDFSSFLNDMGEVRPRYGGVMVKKHEHDGKLEIKVVDWKNLSFTNTANLLKGAIIEDHFLTPAEIAEKIDVWENVPEVLEEASKHFKDKPGCLIQVDEVHGLLPKKFFEEDGSYEYEFRKILRAKVGKKSFILFSEVVEELPYMYLPWDRVSGRDLGRGIVEEGFQAQTWTNDAMISVKNAMELAGKVVLYTNSQKVSGNILTDIDNGHIFELEDGKSINSLNLIPSALPQYDNLINLWKEQYDRVASTFEANTGEQVPSGTPYSQTALLNAAANSPFEYQREVAGIFVNKILNEWVFPHLIKKIKKGHTLTEDFTEDELKIIDESFAIFEANKESKKKIFSGTAVYFEDLVQMIEEKKQILSPYGSRRSIEIPEGYFDNYKGKLTVNITGEQKNKAAALQSLNTILTVVASNPTILQDPTLFKIFATIVEMAGVPISPMQLKPSAQTPQAQPQSINQNALNAISPNGTESTATATQV